MPHHFFVIVLRFTAFALLPPIAMAQPAHEPVLGIKAMTIDPAGRVVSETVNIDSLPPPETEAFRYPISNFDPSMLDTFEFNVASVWDSARSSGSGTDGALVDEDGVLRGADVFSPVPT